MDWKMKPFIFILIGVAFLAASGDARSIEGMTERDETEQRMDNTVDAMMMDSFLQDFDSMISSVHKLTPARELNKRSEPVVDDKAVMSAPLLMNPTKRERKIPDSFAHGLSFQNLNTELSKELEEINSLIATLSRVTPPRKSNGFEDDFPTELKNLFGLLPDQKVKFDSQVPVSKEMKSPFNGGFDGKPMEDFIVFDMDMGDGNGNYPSRHDSVESPAHGYMMDINFELMDPKEELSSRKKYLTFRDLAEKSDGLLESETPSTLDSAGTVTKIDESGTDGTRGEHLSHLKDDHVQRISHGALVAVRSTNKTHKQDISTIDCTNLETLFLYMSMILIFVGVVMICKFWGLSRQLQFDRLDVGGRKKKLVANRSYAVSSSKVGPTHDKLFEYELVV